MGVRVGGYYCVPNAAPTTAYRVSDRSKSIGVITYVPSMESAFTNPTKNIMLVIPNFANTVKHIVYTDTFGRVVLLVSIVFERVLLVGREAGYSPEGLLVIDCV